MTRDHWNDFAAFSKWEKASGGPDPQIPMVIEMSWDQHDEERWWRALCYIAVYNVPFGEVIWRALPWEDFKMMSTREIRDWCDIAFNSQALVTRFERRCVRRADWMTEYLVGAQDLVNRVPKLAEACARRSPTEAYELAWADVNSSPRIGRYVAIKLLELWRRDGTLTIETPDIRPKGAWSPRKTLGELFPGRGIEVKGDDSPSVLVQTNIASCEAIMRLREEYGVEIDHFDLQVLLCEYRESWEGKKQYPGRSLDSELGYAWKAQDLHYPETAMWAARRALFPHKHLGELNGWQGPRKDVAVLLHDEGYVWSDLLYDYTETTNFKEPVAWPLSSSV